MHRLYDLKDMLCEELEKYESKDLTASSLETIDKLAHAIKNIDKIIAMGEDGYSHEYVYRDDMSMRNGRRDARGRYTRAGDISTELRELMQDTHDERVRRPEVERCSQSETYSKL